jgi:effector-binding domain-containing protein
MNRISPFRSAMVALVPIMAIALGGAALAQSPAPSASPSGSPSVAPAPAASPAPTATPAPAASATPAPETSPAPVASPSVAPSPPPAAAQTPAPPAATVQTADPFGEPLTLEPKKVVVLKGSGNWDSAFDTLVDSIKALTALLDKQGIKATGNPMIVFTSTYDNDNRFTFLAEIPVEQEPKNLTKDMSIGKSPEGKALKFVHRGPYENVENTYEAITNHLDDKGLEAKDIFIEEYITDPLKTAEDKLVINIYVPLK